MKRFEVQTMVEITMPDDADESAAVTAVDEIMQRNWDRTEGGRTIRGPQWHFMIDPANVVEVTDFLPPMERNGVVELDEIGANVTDVAPDKPSSSSASRQLDQMFDRIAELDPTAVTRREDRS